VLLLNECLLLFISLSTQSGNFWIHPHKSYASNYFYPQGMHIQNNITPWPLSIMHDILLLTNSILVTDYLISLCNKVLIPKWWITFPFPCESTYSSAGWMPPLSQMIFCTLQHFCSSYCKWNWRSVISLCWPCIAILLHSLYRLSSCPPFFSYLKSTQISWR
jgi:hypothetical protein